MIKIYLCRHGETAWTLSGQHTGSTDIPLTPNGEKQALLLKNLLQKLDLDHVFSSPLKRAVQTATLAGRPPQINPDLHEWNYGDYEGLIEAEIQQRNPSWNVFHDGAPNGETPEQVSKRADRVIQSCLKLKGSIALFSHGHFLRVLAARWVGLSAKEGQIFSLSVASLSLLGTERNHRTIQFWNETSI